MKKITLNLSDKHYGIVAKCAQMEGQSVEEWILHSTEGELRYMADELQGVPFFEYTGEDITEAIKAIPHSKELKAAVA